MPKRRRSDDEGGGPSSGGRRHHLHLVLDDWAKGYNIYTLDVADLDGAAADPGADLDSVATPLPGPPVFRLERSHANYSNPWFSSVGSRIAVTYNEEEEDAPVLLYDTATGGLAVGPPAPAEARFANTFIPHDGAGGARLYMVGRSKFHSGEGHLVVLAEEPGAGRWAWSPVRTPPFKISKSQVVCHAAHPDGRTIFFSVYGGGTYSLDTETQEWTHHGGWMLPFEGRVYYDARLDAWVGLDGAEKGAIRSCDVAAVTGTGEGPPPSWRTDAGQKMVCEDWERTSRVELTHMGRANFCLVEQRFRKGVDAAVGDNVYLFYVTTFKLRYHKDQLRATARRTHCYTMPIQSTGYNWSAIGII